LEKDTSWIQQSGQQAWLDAKKSLWKSVVKNKFSSSLQKLLFNQNVQRSRQRVCYADPLKMHKKTEIPFWKQSVSDPCERQFQNISSQNESPQTNQQYWVFQ